MADSEEKLCRLVSEFGRVYKRRELRVNVGKSKVMRCSRHGNGHRMHVILNGEPLEEVGCFKKPYELCGIRHTDSCKHKSLALQVFSR